MVVSTEGFVDEDWHGPENRQLVDYTRKECPKCSKNIIIRKIINFYIEAIPKTFSQLRKEIFFSSSKKIDKKKLKKSKFSNSFRVLKDFLCNYKGKFSKP